MYLWRRGVDETIKDLWHCLESHHVVSRKMCICKRISQPCVLFLGTDWLRHSRPSLDVEKFRRLIHSFTIVVSLTQDTPADCDTEVDNRSHLYCRQSKIRGQRSVGQGINSWNSWNSWPDGDETHKSKHGKVHKRKLGLKFGTFWLRLTEGYGHHLDAA